MVERKRFRYKKRCVDVMARDVGLEPTRPFDHRLSRPAPYQAWGIPPCCLVAVENMGTPIFAYCIDWLLL